MGDAYLIINKNYEESTQVLEVLTEKEFKDPDYELGKYYDWRVCNSSKKIL